MLLRELIARRAGGDESGIPADEHEDELELLEYDGLVERVADLYRASPWAMELSKGPDRPLRRYAHILLELEDKGYGLDDRYSVDTTVDPFAALRDAVDRVPGATTIGIAIPPLKRPDDVARGWVDAIAEAHEIDDEDEEAEQLYDAAVAAVTALIQGPRRTL